MTPELPPDVQEAIDREEQAFMHRRTAMEEYGGMMAKMFSQLGDGDDDPAKQEMIKQAFADIMCPKRTLPAMMYPPPEPPGPQIPSHVFEHIEGKTITVYNFTAYANEAANFQRTVDGHVKFFSALDVLTGELQGLPAERFWEWHCAIQLLRIGDRTE